MSAKYPKDSFDRFGDDLCELLVSYVSTEDKIAFECVCRQWQRLLFSRQFRFQLSRLRFKSDAKTSLTSLTPLFVRSYVHQIQTFQLNAQLLHSLLKKFTDLNELLIDNNCKCDENVLNIFCDLYENCFQNLKTIQFRVKDDINEQVLSRFGTTFGNTLTNVSIAGLSAQKLSNVLTYFGQNVRTIDLKQNLCSLMTESNSSDERVFRRLEKVFLTNPSTEDFELFVRKYAKQLKHLSLSFDEHYRHNIKNTLKFVANLESLLSLRLESELFFLKQQDSQFDGHNMIDESLQLIGQKCLRLCSVDICIFGDLISDTFLKIFGKHFKCLEHLDLALWDIGDKDFNCVNSFGFRPDNGRHLTKLNLMFEQLCDDHLKDIHIYLPNLRAIKLNSDEHLTDECLRHLSKLPKLRTIVLEGNIDINYLTINGVMEFVSTCSKTIQIIDIEFENDLNEISYDIFKLLAQMTPQINYYISFHDYEDRNKDLCVYRNPKSNLHVYKI